MHNKFSYQVELLEPLPQPLDLLRVEVRGHLHGQARLVTHDCCFFSLPLLPVQNILMMLQLKWLLVNDAPYLTMMLAVTAIKDKGSFLLLLLSSPCKFFDWLLQH